MPVCRRGLVTLTPGAVFAHGGAGARRRRFPLDARLLLRRQVSASHAFDGIRWRGAPNVCRPGVAVSVLPGRCMRS